MAVECPVSFETVDERVVRGVALIVFASAIVFLATPHRWTAAILAGDFFLRACGKPRLSPLAALVRIVARALKLAPKPTDAAPKRFAAGVGAVFSLAMLGLWLAGQDTASLVVACLLLACSALEGLLAFCVGCQVYTLLKPLLDRKPSTAPTPPPES